MTEAIEASPPLRERALDSDQGAAVHATLERPLLVVAGPGAGKTRVLTQRIVHLVRSGAAAPAQIAAITFTNAAAAEMAERVQAGLGAERVGVRISTIHALAAQIVRRHPEAVGIDAQFSIFGPQSTPRMPSTELPPGSTSPVSATGATWSNSSARSFPERVGLSPTCRDSVVGRERAAPRSLPTLGSGWRNPPVPFFALNRPPSSRAACEQQTQTPIPSCLDLPSS
jgi:UvrD/REP helicase N-terminal domain